MMQIDSALIRVITTYHRFIRRAIHHLQVTYHYDDVIQALKCGVIPRTGGAEEHPFSFHGIGCSMEIDGYVVNWDFGPGGRIDGFEAWKLWEFTHDHPEEFGAYAELASLRSAITDLIAQGSVSTMRDFGSVGNSVFFKENIRALLLAENT
ncbi:MAG: hypothetical protein HGA41_03610 [Syntrophaceae bacterium]|nr:hypothetical protein [Syntrophaceae bacterium]